MNESIKNYLEKYHNSKTNKEIYNPMDLTIEVHFENGEKTKLGFLTIEKLTFANVSYESFCDFYVEHLNAIKGAKWLD